MTPAERELIEQVQRLESECNSLRDLLVDVMTKAAAKAAAAAKVEEELTRVRADGAETRKQLGWAQLQLRLTRLWGEEVDDLRRRLEAAQPTLDAVHAARSALQMLRETCNAAPDVQALARQHYQAAHDSVFVSKSERTPETPLAAQLADSAARGDWKDGKGRPMNP